MRWRSLLVAPALVVACAKGEPVEPQLSTTFPGDDGGASSSGTAASADAAAAGSSSGTPGDTTSSEGSTGLQAESTGDDPGIPGWLLTVDDVGPAARLMRIDAGTAQTSVVCTLAPGITFDSLAITRSGDIYGHDPVADLLRRIDPCTCGVFDVMSSQGPMQITPDEGDGLYGLRTATGELVAIDPASATFAHVGDLGLEFTDAAIAWADTIDAIYAVSGDNDRLYFVDPGVTVSLITDLALDVAGIGLEQHAGTELLYVCTAAAQLQWIDVTTGGVVTIAPMPGLGSCNDLAAPWGPVSCVPD